jgi:dTDP-glucose 4,6-dehydratase
MKILITGAAGFIGTNVCKYFIETYPQWDIVGIDRISYCSSLFWSSEVNNTKCPNFLFIKADITDMSQMTSLFKMLKFDIVLHLAAQTHVDNSFGNSLCFTHDNVYGTHVLLEHAKQYNVQLFIHMSTDEVYGNTSHSSSSASTEASYLSPTNPYAASKASAEFLVNSYNISFKLPTVILRANNIYGIGQFPEKLIPRTILRILRNKSVTIQGTGKQKRSWLHIDDLIRAYELIINFSEREKILGETFNIASNEEVNVETICYYLTEISNKANCIIYIKDRPFNDQRYWIDSTKFSSLFGWQPKKKIKESLTDIFNWYAMINREEKIINAYWDKEHVKNALGD